MASATGGGGGQGQKGVCIYKWVPSRAGIAFYLGFWVMFMTLLLRFKIDTTRFSFIHAVQYFTAVDIVDHNSHVYRRNREPGVRCRSNRVRRPKQ